jgi:GH15 family glucan-1,4-alpha-glucosidase
MGDQHYIADSNVLRTHFKAGQGQLAVTDFMPIWGDIHGFGKSYAYDQIHRILECRGSDMAVEVEWSPRHDYARAAVTIEREHRQWQVSTGDEMIFLCGLEEGKVLDENFGPILRGRFRMKHGEKRVLITGWGSEAVDCDLERSLAMMDETVKTWRGWAYREEAEHLPEMFGDHFPLLIRSEIVLKMVSNADNGAIAAAPTTSLPEDIGGVRNWDYRYAWIRDGFMTAQALISLGHRTDALEFLHWIEEISEASFREGNGLSIMHRLNGGSEVAEIVLHHLEGYRGSRPVRIGKFDEERNSFVIHFGSKDLDAANLRIPMLGFLPAEDPRVQGTIDRVLEELTENGLVYRYICDDGLPGKEGAFGLCTFWLVDALALSGRLDEAWETFEGIVGRANHLGLFPEQFNPTTREFLGNFPQAYTHIGMINSAIYLAHASSQKAPAEVRKR